MNLRPLFAVLGSLALACQSPPDDLRQWRLSDHTNTGETGAVQKGQVDGQAAPNQFGLDPVTLSAWQNNCVSCHGKIGRGDGPQAFVFKPRDLTDPEFQGAVSDEQLLAAIQLGKGKMPGFALPQETALGLVRLVRLLGGRGRAATASSATATTAPTASPSATPTR